MHNGRFVQTVRSTVNVLMIAYTNYESDPRVMREAQAAADAGFSVDFIALRRRGQAPEEMIRGVKVLRLPQERYRGKSRVRYLLSYLEFFVRCAVTSARLHANRRYRVVHVNNMPDVLVWSVALLKLFGAKIILDIHDPMPETFGSKFGGGRSALYRVLLFIERLSVQLADRTITVSEPVKSGVLLQHGYRPEAIGVVANFADDELFQLLPYPPIERKVRFAFHGTILERYGLRTLVDALKMARYRTAMEVRIIGDGDFSETLASLIRSEGLGDVVDFRNKVYPLREIPGLLADCHVGLVPLKSSSVANFALPLKLVEYTCLGMPTITIRNAAIEYYFRPDECLFFDAGDAEALARLMDEVVVDPAKLLDYRRKLLGARQRLLWSGERQKYLGILQELAGRSPVPSVHTATVSRPAE
jgi:glycosyltransferase involved in cell wall biosynthesis